MLYSHSRFVSNDYRGLNDLEGTFSNHDTLKKTKKVVSPSLLQMMLETLFCYFKSVSRNAIANDA